MSLEHTALLLVKLYVQVRVVQEVLDEFTHGAEFALTGTSNFTAPLPPILAKTHQSLKEIAMLSDALHSHE